MTRARGIVDVAVSPLGSQNGLFLTTAATKGQVLLTVPKPACIVIDYASGSGLSIGQGAWPRLAEGLSAPDALPWDLLQALALMDGLAGDGTPFWQAYCEHLLPDPAGLTMPMCWEEPRLRQLQHAAIEDGALQQQQRLRSLMPHLMEPLDADVPSWLQWAFACVRSRAFKVGPEAFAFVPFLDVANHSDRPTADFRTCDEGYQLVAMEDVAAGQEATISYTGPGGYTNQRLMAQYGFVPPGGNAADRAELKLPSGPALLDLDRLQRALGTRAFAAAASGGNPHLFAAIKSLPFNLSLDSSSAASWSTTAASASTEDMRVAQELLQQCDETLQAFPTTLEDDEALLQTLVAGPAAGGASSTLEPPQGQQQASQQLHQHQNGPAVAAGGDDPRYEAALRYRLERKRLYRACRTLLGIYVRDR